MPLIGLGYGTRPIWIKWLLGVPLANGGRRVRFLPRLPLRAKADMKTFCAGSWWMPTCLHRARVCPSPLLSLLPAIKKQWLRLKGDGSLFFLGPKSSRGTLCKHNHLLWWSSHIRQMKRTNVSRCGGGFTEMAFLMVSYLMIVLTQW